MDKIFKKKIIALRGELGKKWLCDLPEIIKNYEDKSSDIYLQNAEILDGIRF